MARSFKRPNTITRLWRRIFPKRYTVDEVMMRIDAIIHGTYPRREVHEAIAAIDRFNAGAIDPALTRHIRDVLTNLERGDKAWNREVRRRIWEALVDG